jgi:hypothetical protein
VTQKFLYSYTSATYDLQRDFAFPSEIQVKENKQWGKGTPKYIRQKFTWDFSWRIGWDWEKQFISYHRKSPVLGRQCMYRHHQMFLFVILPSYKQHFHVRSEVSTAMKICLVGCNALWCCDRIPAFGRSFCLHLQGETKSFETLVSCINTRRHNPLDHDFNINFL